MKIGVDVRSLAASAGRGVSHYTASLLGELVAAHPEDTWQLLQTGRQAFALPANLQQPNVELTHVRYPNKLLNAGWSLQPWPQLERWLGGIDVFFAPNLGFVRLGRRTPLVTTVHDLSFVLFPQLYSRRERLWHRAVDPRRLLARSTAVIAVSGQTEQELTTLYKLPPGKVSVVHSGIDEIYRRPVSPAAIAAVRKKYKLPDSYVLFLGALEPRKNLPTLLAAFRLAREAGLTSELVLAGQAKRGELPAGQTTGVHVLGYVDEADKPALYAAANSLVNVSLHEGFGFPPLEALACGTPSVVSDLPVFAETLGAAAIRITPTDPARLAEKLVHLERDQALRAALLGRGPDVLGPLTWRHAAAQTYAVLTAASHDHAK